VRLQFDFGKDGCAGIDGWYLDNFAISTCPGGVPNDAEGQVLNRFGSVGTLTPEPNGAPLPDRAIQVRMVKMYHSGSSPICVGGANDGANCTADGDCAGGVCVPACPQRLASLPDLSAFEGQVRWLAAPCAYSEDTVPPDPDWIGATLQCLPHIRDWSTDGLKAEFGAQADASRVYFFGSEMVPCSVYEVRHGDAACVGSADPDACLSPPLLIKTAKWGDVATPFGLTNFDDIAAEVAKFKGVPFPQAPREAAALLRENVAGNIVPCTDTKVNFSDISKVIQGFKSIGYDAAGPQDCP
jgi:hypothetical protein